MRDTEKIREIPETLQAWELIYQRIILWVVARQIGLERERKISEKIQGNLMDLNLS